MKLAIKLWAFYSRDEAKYANREKYILQFQVTDGDE